jgi:hypothetical protein
MITTAVLMYLNYAHGADISWWFLIATVVFDLMTCAKTKIYNNKVK